ncbi:unnamed protein product [Rhizoctonia solani]|uniref:Uncharacterized protein n=1 Tax=Rhizoctonia solani TaxID=456999 RepID=A0A8H2WSR3_9AGAM|nr:unnamed protein product [Rhizoctonia solani]
MRDPVFPAFCALALALLLLVLPTHVRTRNSGTLLFIGWTFTTTLIFFVNSIVWAGNLSDPAPVWCDISAKIMIAASVGLSASSLCINRRLYHILHPQFAHSDAKSKRRTLIVDLATALGLPVLVMILHTVVQGHRYDILEDVGCYPTTYGTLLAIPMVYMWPILVGLVGLFYTTLTIHELINRRRQLSTTLSSSHAGMSSSQYFRLMALAATDLLFSTSLSLFVLVINIGTNTLNPWISWADTHQGFSTIKFVSWETFDLIPLQKTVLQISRWSPPALGVMFFLYFGISGEAVAEYRRWFWAIAGLFGMKNKNNSGYNSKWSNHLASNSSSAPRNVSFPSARPTNSLDRALKDDLESQLQSRDSLGLDNISKPGDLQVAKPPGL